MSPAAVEDFSGAFMGGNPFEQGEQLLLVLKTGVAGLNYCGIDPDAKEGKRFLKSLKPGTELKLTREADNIHDRWAITVSTAGGKPLGYLTRFKNETISRLMDQGKRFVAVVDEPPAPPKDEDEARRTIAPTEDYDLPISIFMAD